MNKFKSVQPVEVGILWRHRPSSDSAADEFDLKAATPRAQQPEILHNLPTIDPVRQPARLGSGLCLCASVDVQSFVYSASKVKPYPGLAESMAPLAQKHTKVRKMEAPKKDLHTCKI